MCLTQEAINARAAEAGFTVGDYVHHFLRTYRAAGRIKSFFLLDDVLTVSWMDGATSCPLSEVRLSSGHQRRAQFGPGYDFFTSPALIAEALRQGQVSEDLRFDYTGAWVKGYGTERAEVWATFQPDPYDEATAFMRVSDAPAFYAPGPELSSAEVAPVAPAPQAIEADSDHKLQVLVSGQPITERAIEGCC